MSIQTTKAVIKTFLSNTDANILALIGAWGVGKTYAWREALIENRNYIQFDKYCYVSLFGISNMAELRMALFTKSIAVSSLCKTIDLEAIREDWTPISKDWFKGMYGRFAPLFKSLPYGTSISLGVEAFAASSVRDCLVCIDDFERQTTIKVEDILGLITELKEERGCKIVLIFNKEELQHKEVYQLYREKMIDLEAQYSPTIQEAFDIVFDASSPNRELVIRHVLDLDITNVRILRKIHQLISQISAATRGLHSQVIESSIATTVLLCWCAYAPDVSKPKFEDIEKWNKTLMSFKSQSEQDPVELIWSQRLKAYGFSAVDELDLAIARVVSCGYVEGTGLIEAAQVYDSQYRKKDLSNPFAEVWRWFHGSFLGDQDQFIKDLNDAALQAISQIRVGDLNETVTLLRSLARDDFADNLIDKFVETHRSTPAIFDLSDYSFSGSVNDTKLRSTFDALHSNLAKLPTLVEAFIFMNKGSYGLEHIEAMKKASVDDYEAMFLKTHKDISLSDLIKWSMRWAADTDKAQITFKAKQALERIKATSLLNAIRTSRYGI